MSMYVCMSCVACYRRIEATIYILKDPVLSYYYYYDVQYIHSSLLLFYYAMLILYIYIYIYIILLYNIYYYITARNL